MGFLIKETLHTADIVNKEKNKKKIKVQPDKKAILACKIKLIPSDMVKKNDTIVIIYLAMVFSVYVIIPQTHFMISTITSKQEL